MCSRVAVLTALLAVNLSIAESARAFNQAPVQSSGEAGQLGAQLANQAGAQLAQLTGTAAAAVLQSSSQDQSQSKPPDTTAPVQPGQTGTYVPGQQTNRILGVMPNYRAVSANTQLPPLSVKGKFVMASKDSLDYTSFLFVGLLSGVRMALRQEPSFGDGMDAYGKYAWRSTADQDIGNYFTEAIMPSILHEDPHYYTLGRGRAMHRVAYSFSRILITKTDAGGTRFNYSEVIGNGFAAGIANLYYPAQDRSLKTTGVNWAEQLISDGLANVLKEFWPDIRDLIHHRKPPQP